MHFMLVRVVPKQSPSFGQTLMALEGYSMTLSLSKGSDDVMTDI